MIFFFLLSIKTVCVINWHLKQLFKQHRFKYILPAYAADESLVKVIYQMWSFCTRQCKTELFSSHSYTVTANNEGAKVLPVIKWFWVKSNIFWEFGEFQRWYWESNIFCSLKEWAKLKPFTRNAFRNAFWESQTLGALLSISERLQSCSFWLQIHKHSSANVRVTRYAEKRTNRLYKRLTICAVRKLI